MRGQPGGLSCLQGWDGAEATPHGLGSYQSTGHTGANWKVSALRWQTQPVLEGGLGLVHSVPPPPAACPQEDTGQPCLGMEGCRGGTGCRRRGGGS